MNAKLSRPVKILLLSLSIVVLVVLVFFVVKKENWLPSFSTWSGPALVQLPEPLYQSKTSLEEALKERRSQREYKNEAISIEQLSQLLWAAQGVTATNGLRTAPSAGALYPLDVYVISGNIQNLAAGIYHYVPAKHALELLSAGDKRQELAATEQDQKASKNEAAAIVITGRYKVSIEKYANRGERFVQMEAGHAAENVLLEAVSVHVGTVPIGNFDENALKQLLNLPQDQEPLYILPLGKM